MTTKDGVTVDAGAVVWGLHGHPFRVCYKLQPINKECARTIMKSDPDRRKVEDCYSSEEAAKKARTNEAG